jgi:Icc-related predicted phosphoesterase
MKILAAGDIHGDIDAAKKLAEKAEKNKVDLVLLSGDLTMGEFSTEGLLGPFVKKNIKVAIVPGNHESIATTSALAEIYKAINLHGYSIYTDEVGIFGAGSANIGIFQLSENELFDLLKKGFDKVKNKKKKIMVTHVHPEGTLPSKLSTFPGSAAVTKAISTFKPDIAICSHIHEAEGIEDRIGNTKLIVVGKTGKIINV